MVVLYVCLYANAPDEEKGEERKGNETDLIEGLIAPAEQHSFAFYQHNSHKV